MKKTTLLALLLSALLQVNGQTLDQSQLIYNGGLSARTLAGYSFFQSFTAGLTGTLVEIDLGVFNYINGAGTLKIYSGSNNLGTLLQSTPVTVTCPSGNCFTAFSTAVPVTAGQVYTFQFVPGVGIPDPYGVQVQSPGTYPGGQFGLIDPSGTYYIGYDLIFKTFVTTGLGITETDYHTTSLYPNPFSDTTQWHTAMALTEGSLHIYNLMGQEVKQIQALTGTDITFSREGLSNGIYIAQLQEKGKILSTQKLLVTN